MRLTLLLPCSLFILGTALPALADVYKWVDATGKTHYSDVPPDDGSKAVPLSGMPHPQTGTSDPAGKGDGGAKADPGKGGDTKPGGGPLGGGKMIGIEDKAAMAKQRSESCERSHSELNVLQADNRIYTVDDKGERQYIDDAARAARVAELQKIIAADCN